MFYKVLQGNLLVDLLTEVQWVRYLPKQKRLVATDSQSANGIMSSDRNTVYHLSGRPDTFDDEVKSVQVIKINGDEYSRLSTEFAIAKKENEDLRGEMATLKEQMNEQSRMLEMILSKLA